MACMVMLVCTLHGMYGDVGVYTACMVVMVCTLYGDVGVCTLCGDVGVYTVWW